MTTETNNALKTGAEGNRVKKALREKLVSLGMDAQASDDDAYLFLESQIKDGGIDGRAVLELDRTKGESTDVATDVATETKTATAVDEKSADEPGDNDALLESLLARATSRVAAETRNAQEDALVAKMMERLRQEDAKAKARATPGVTDPRLVKVLGGIIGRDSDDLPQVRVKKAIEQYSSTKSARVVKRGRDWVPMVFMGRELNHASQAEKACYGAWLKRKFKLSLNEHEQDLLRYLVHEGDWSGNIGSEQVWNVIDGQKLGDWHRKALIDDATSGGQELSPRGFDEEVVATLLLGSELFPLVTLKPATTRIVDGSNIGAMTLTWGASDATAISAESGNSLIGAVDITMRQVVGAINISRDLESDSPVDVAGTVSEQFGNALARELDRVIAIGNGSTQPQGIIGASGVGVTASVSNTAGPVKLLDLESLLFGVPKQYRAPSDPVVFCSNDTTYQRFRSMATGISGDDTRLLGMTHEDYMSLNRPHKIQNDMTNSQAFFGNMRYYRMYRRAGLEIQMSTEGSTLMLANQMLVVVRARYGGAPALAAPFETMTSLKA